MDPHQILAPELHDTIYTVIKTIHTSSTSSICPSPQLMVTAIVTRVQGGGRRSAVGGKKEATWSSRFPLATKGDGKRPRERALRDDPRDGDHLETARASRRTLLRTVMQERPRLARPLRAGSTGLNCSRAARRVRLRKLVGLGLGARSGCERAAALDGPPMEYLINYPLSGHVSSYRGFLPLRCRATPRY